jgi:DNA polymerase (family 10)
MSQLREGTRPVGWNFVQPSVEDEIRRIGLEGVMYWITGSFRRMKHLCNDIDVVLIAQKHLHTSISHKLMQRFGSLITDASRPKTNVVDGQIAYQFHITEPYRLGSMLLHTTGSVDFNKLMRTRAIQKGWKLNQYGLFDGYGNVVLGSEYEEEFFRKLDMEYVLPKMRM